jgi:deoxyribodipyrimidine photolyase-related protein
MTKILRFVLGDQLTRGVSSLADAKTDEDVILMVEVRAEATSVKHHKQKIVLVLSAMRHFAESLREEGFTVDYIKLDDPGNTQNFSSELQRAITRHGADHVVVTEPSEWRVWQLALEWQARLGVPVEVRDDDRFFCSRQTFAKWAEGRRNYRMEFFYREMRKISGLLMQDGEPIGGQWNFDAENRKKLPVGTVVPPRLTFAPDTITKDVIALTSEHFANHFGNLQPFHWAVTRDDALQVLEYFIAHGLPDFGDYQDAMKTGEDFVFHSALSPYLNIGLLTAREVCDAAAAAYHRGAAPLNAAEGFIRQILGWREFVRGIYWTEMPAYAESNHLSATRPLPWFYWSGETKMKCLSECIRNTKDNAYAHHIQRLMVLGNFALLAGIMPAEIEEWFLVVYADAFEWVELPNVHGMVMHADGGLLGSKPYAASGAYINRMSDYCKACVYDPALKTGPKACPFNYLYWNFLMENEAVLAGNPRMAMPYRNLGRMADVHKTTIKAEANAFLDGLANMP